MKDLMRIMIEAEVPFIFTLPDAENSPEIPPSGKTLPKDN
jgi:hypothetical protein